MKILLDTHILLWTLSDNPNLSQKAREIILDERNMLYYSAVSLWEIELKHIAKPKILMTSAEEIHRYCQKSGSFDLLEFSTSDIFCMNQLRRKPDTPEHHDPFDRLLLVQAINNNFQFMTHDFLITGYDSNNIIHV